MISTAKRLLIAGGGYADIPLILAAREWLFRKQAETMKMIRGISIRTDTSKPISQTRKRFCEPRVITK